MQKRLFGIAAALTGLLASTAPSSAQDMGGMFCDSVLSFLCPSPPPPPPPPAPMADAPPPMAAPVHKKKVPRHKKVAKPAAPAEAPAAPQ